MASDTERDYKPQHQHQVYREPTLTSSQSQPNGLKRRPTIIIKPKESKPYLLVKTTRAKEEEKQKDRLAPILYPVNKSQSTLRYHRAFKSVVEAATANANDSRSIGTADGSSLDRSEISMYNTDNSQVKHIYTTKSLITQRYQNSPYVHSPAKKRMDTKPWRENMSNRNFIESTEQKKFLNMLQKDVEIN